MQNILAHFIWSETGRKGGRERRSDRERKGGMGAEIQGLAGEGGVSSSGGEGGGVIRVISTPHADGDSPLWISQSIVAGGGERTNLSVNHWLFTSNDPCH